MEAVCSLQSVYDILSEVFHFHLLNSYQHFQRFMYNILYYSAYCLNFALSTVHYYLTSNG